MALLLLLAALFTDAQSPIEITQHVGLEARGSGTPAEVLFTDVKNVSSKRVLGVVFLVQFWDGSTAARRTRLTGSIHQANKAGKPTYFEPDQTNSTLPIPIGRNASGVLDTFKAKVDLVVFEDGSTWGLGRLPESAKLLADIQPGR